MKLKPINIKHTVLVDESAEIKTERLTKDMNWVSKNYPNITFKNNKSIKCIML